MQWNKETIVSILRPCANKVFEQEYINQSGKEFLFLFTSGLSHDFKRFSLILSLILNYYLPKFWSPGGKLRDCKGAYVCLPQTNF